MPPLLNVKRVTPGDRASRLWALAAALTVAATPACGKKGPPLAPLSNRPRAPEAVTAHRQGGQVLIRFTIPRANQSGVQPANLERVDVYALTGPRLPAAEFVEEATVIATVPVRRPPPPDEEAPEKPEPDPDPTALDQGAPAVVTEALTPAAFQPVDVKPQRERDRRQARPRSSVVVRRTDLAPPDVGVPLKEPPVRYYAAAGFNRSGRRGSLSTIVAVRLDAEAPPAPAQPSATVRERSVELAWEPPPGLRGTTPPDSDEPAREDAPEAADPPAEREPGAGDDSEESDNGAEDEDEPEAERAPEPEDPGGSSRTRVLRSRPLQLWRKPTAGYNVYVVPAPDAERSQVSAYAAASLPERLNPKPLSQPAYSDAKVEFGATRCYVVRSVQTIGTATAESAPSPARCVKVADVFPPAAPKSLAAVVTEKGINLIWERNSEADLGGYLVLRSDLPDGPLQPLRAEPVRENTWRDTTIQSGVRYRYAVVAVDKASPANRSEPSNIVEVTAR